MRKLGCFITIVLVLSTSQSFAVAPFSILVFGDSIGKGIGAHIKEAFEDKNVKITNRAIVSDGLLQPGSKRRKAEFEGLIKCGKFDAVILSYGTNDIRKESGTEKWKESYKQVVKDFLRVAFEHKVPVTVVGLPPMRSGLPKSHAQDINQVLQEVVDELADYCYYVDTFSQMSDTNGNYVDSIKIRGKTVKIRSGGVHFTPDGYDLLSQIVAADVTSD